MRLPFQSSNPESEFCWFYSPVFNNPTRFSNFRKIGRWFSITGKEEKMGMDAKEKEDDEELNKGNIVITQVNGHSNVFWVI